MSHILIPKNIIRGGLGKYVEAGVEMPPVMLKGHFRVELISRAGIIKKVLEFDNLITNGGLDGLATKGLSAGGSSLLTYAAVGTGSTAPTNADTTLVSEIAPASTNRTNSNGSVADVLTYVSGTPDYYNFVRTFLFDFTQGNGNLTEIGLFTASSSGTMWTRQLLKDSGGTPTTIVKTSSDQLKVTYTLQLYPLQSDVTGSITISSTSYSYTIRAANVGPTTRYSDFFYYGCLGFAMKAHSDALAARTSEPSAGSISPTSTSIASYSAGNYYLECTAVWSAATANFGGSGITAFRIWSPNGAGSFLMQMGITGGLPKDTTKQLTLVVRKYWGRYP